MESAMNTTADAIEHEVNKKTKRDFKSDPPARPIDFEPPVGPRDREELQQEIDALRVRLAELYARPSARGITSSAGPTADKRGASPPGDGQKRVPLSVAGGVVKRRPGLDEPVQGREDGTVAIASPRKASAPCIFEAFGQGCSRFRAAPGVCKTPGSDLLESFQNLLMSSTDRGTFQAPPARLELHG